MKRSSTQHVNKIASSRSLHYNPSTMKRSSTQNVKKISSSRSIQNESFSKTQRYRASTLTRGSKLGSKLVNELRSELGISSFSLVHELRRELGVSSSLHKNPPQSLGQRLWRVWAETQRHRLSKLTRGSAAIANELRDELGLSSFSLVHELRRELGVSSSIQLGQRSASQLKEIRRISINKQKGRGKLKGSPLEQSLMDSPLLAYASANLESAQYVSPKE